MMAILMIQLDCIPDIQDNGKTQSCGGDTIMYYQPQHPQYAPYPSTTNANQLDPYWTNHPGVQHNPIMQNEHRNENMYMAGGEVVP